MKNYSLQYKQVLPNDKDIPLLFEIHKLPGISKFISIDNLNYFNYVTNTNNVYYYKVKYKDKIVSTVHIEKQENILYLSVLVLPKYQNKGFGTQILNDIKSKQIIQNFSKIIVSIDKENVSSIKLFEKAGFLLKFEEDELLEYHLSV